MIEMLFGLVKLGITECAKVMRAGLDQAVHVRRQPLRDRGFDVAGLGAVDAHDHGRGAREAIGPAVGGHGVGSAGQHDLAFPSCATAALAGVEFRSRV